MAQGYKKDGTNLEQSFKKGNIPWNKGTHIYNGGGAKKGYKLSEAIKIKISETHKKNKLNVGNKSPFWKGGKFKDSKGYIRIKDYTHPFGGSGHYIFEHRLVMEKAIGRYLTPIEVVHHINGIKDDNRIENLELFSESVKHNRSIHNKIECPFCHKHFLIT